MSWRLGQAPRRAAIAGHVTLMPYLHGEPGDLLAAGVPERTAGVCRGGHGVYLLGGAGSLTFTGTAVYLVEQSPASHRRPPARTERRWASEESTGLRLTTDGAARPLSRREPIKHSGTSPLCSTSMAFLGALLPDLTRLRGLSILCERARGFDLHQQLADRCKRAQPCRRFPREAALTFRRPICFLKSSENSFFLLVLSSSPRPLSLSSYLQAIDQSRAAWSGSTR